MKALSRLLLAFVVGLVVTGGMFLFLRTLISAQVDIATLKPAVRIEFGRLRRDTDVQSRRDIKPELDLRPQAPTTATVGATASVGVAMGPLAASPVSVAGTGAMVAAGVAGSMRTRMTVSGGGSDRDVMPLVRIEPEYPRRAADQGLEGWVLLQFTITPLGTVRDAVVIDSSPKRIFDDAAVRAVLRWKYNPKIDEGVAVERRGVQVVLRFQLEKE